MIYRLAILAVLLLVSACKVEADLNLNNSSTSDDQRVLDSCAQNEVKKNNQCLPKICTPNEILLPLSCTNDASFSLSAEKTKSCDSTGTEYVLGPCIPKSCKAGYQIINNECKKDFEVSNWKAFYDGSAFGENVPRPAINYIYNYFRGIDSNRFQATWKGTLTVRGASKGLNINCNQNSLIKINGVESLINSNSLYREFPPGDHQIEIQYWNSWHTTNFNLSFSDYPQYSESQVSQILADKIDGNTEIIYLAASQSKDFFNEVTVSLSAVRKPVVIFMDSYESINWNIHNPNNIEIKAVVMTSYKPGSLVNNPEFVIRLPSQLYGYDQDIVQVQNKIKALTGGRQADKVVRGYSTDNFVIPPDINLSLPTDNKARCESLFGHQIINNECKRDFDVSNWKTSYGSGSSNLDVPRAAMNHRNHDLLRGMGGSYRATWKGTLTVRGASKGLNINVNQSSAFTKIKVNGILKHDLSRDSQSFYSVFPKGDHQIEVEYWKDWFGATFNLSFTDYPQYSEAQVPQVLAAKADGNTQIVYLAAYESSHIYNEVTVSLAAVTKPIILFLGSYEPITWKIQNPNKIEIKAILINSYDPGSLVDNPELVIPLPSLIYTYDQDLVQVQNQIKTLTGGKEADKVLRSYATDSFVIPP